MWNFLPFFRQLLASGSADHTVMIWDMEKKKGHRSIAVFEEKVQSVKWHPMESQTLLTGSCEGYESFLYFSLLYFILALKILLTRLLNYETERSDFLISEV